VVCIILQRFVFEPLGIPFALTTVLLVLLIWLYTRKGGIKTLVWTDSLQTLCLFTALLIIIYKVATDLNMTMGEAISAVSGHELSRVFVWDDWVSKQNFWKQFLSGVFIVLVMTGVDQDMMQKNLTCKTLRGAQKDMCTYGVAFLPANLLFLSLGVLLTMWYQQQGMPIPTMGDDLLPNYIEQVSSNNNCQLSIVNYQLTELLFVLGIVAASFSSADSALTSLTTIYCVDIKERASDEPLRKRVHLAMCGLFVLFILLFKAVNSTSLIDAVYIIASYTYGPLLGLFAYGLLTHKEVNDRWVPYIAIASPLLCYVIDWGIGQLTGYRFGYELLMLNALFTFVGLAASRYLRP
jgi:Na+/proline symporter